MARAGARLDAMCRAFWRLTARLRPTHWATSSAPERVGCAHPPMPTSAPPKLGPIASLLGSLGAVFIGALIRVFGRVVDEAQTPWLRGPLGSAHIGDRPYEELAAHEGLSVVRRAREGGLIQDFNALACDSFDVARVQPAIRRFYENTARYRMDVWAKSSFPANIGLWLLVTTISRKVDQLNFPLDVLDTAKGMDSEIVLLCDEHGRARYAGWYRRLIESGRAIYTGFYMCARVPHGDRPCVKVVFPMPQGNATVLLAPRLDAQGNLELDSRGTGFGDVGFYRVQRAGPGKLRVWRVRSLVEHFQVYVDESGVLRCDHRVRFLGLPVLALHYRITET